jgi:hypothetical protein
MWERYLYRLPPPASPFPAVAAAMLPLTRAQPTPTGPLVLCPSPYSSPPPHPPPTCTVLWYAARSSGSSKG